MSRIKKAKRAATKPTLTSVFSPRDAATLKIIDRRLLRACDLLSCLEYCQDAELNLGALAITTRDLLDVARCELERLLRLVQR